MNNPTDPLHDLPVPEDDGACDHLPGRRLPSVPLPASGGGTVDPATLTGRFVIYFFPMMADPQSGPPEGWSDIPGAKGCTPQACSFRDHHAELRGLGIGIYGVSVQTPAEQQEAAQRLSLPFELLSDSALEFASALQLPTFEHDGRTFIKRLTLIVRDGVIEHVFYPVFPPDSNAEQILGWLRQDGT